jgi:putative flippase GtrA
MPPLVVAQFVRFATVGATNTVVSLLAYAVALRAGAPYLPAGAAAFGLGALNGFLLNRAWTFRHAGRALPAGARYAIVQLLGLGATVGLLWVAVHGVGVPRLPGEVVAAGPVTLLTFALSRLWVFEARPSHDEAASPPALAAPGRPGPRLATDSGPRGAPGARRSARGRARRLLRAGAGERRGR